MGDRCKKFFKGLCAYRLGKEYFPSSKSPIRQDYLETVLKWASEDIKNSKDKIKDFMSINQNNTDASSLKKYFKDVISWIEKTFINKRDKMKGVPWGSLYNRFKNHKVDPKKLEKEIEKLFLDDDVDNKAGIYTYVLSREEKFLNLRAFSVKLSRKPMKTKRNMWTLCEI